MESRSTDAAEAEVAQLASELIKIDSSNFGNDEGPGEAEIADYVLQRLAEVGVSAERFATTSDRRQGVWFRYPGRNRDRGALLVHGHLDTVPAPEPEWLHPPFGGVIDADGTIWGRGAVDMKDMDAMMLALVRDWKTNNVVPDRDIVFLWLPDEEAGGEHGAFWLTANRPDIFEGVTEAIGEVGGFSLTLADDLRLYPIQVAEKGLAWLRIIAQGSAGHGSLINEDNAVAALCTAAARIGHHRSPVELSPAARQFAQTLTELTGLELDLDDPQQLVRQLGGVGRVVGSASRDTMNLTMLAAGYKANVIPDTAEMVVDCRFVPGHRDRMLEMVRELIGPDLRIEEIQLVDAVETTFDGPTIDLMAACLRAEDPAATTAPYLMTGGTDAKAFAELGIRCYGFSPLILPPELDFFGMFHAVNERVPGDALKFGARVLDRFLRAA